MSLLIPLTIRWQGRALAQRLDAAARNPKQAQQQCLQHLLTRHQHTDFGRGHNFAQIHTSTDYQRAVPMRDYEGFRPYVQRMMQGETNVLVSDPVTMFTLTSGTTGQPKYIPVTQPSETRNSALMRQWLYRLLRKHPGCLNRALLGIVSPAVEGHTASGIPYGSLSGRIYQQLPPIIRQAYAVPYEIFEIQDYDLRYWAIARFALARQLSFVGTPNPSTLLRLAAVINTHGEDLIRSIHNGTLGLAMAACSKAVQERLRARLRPAPKRARHLEQIVETTESLHPKDCWPHLQAIGCWTGGSVGLQTQQLGSVYGAVPLRDLGYLASEARVTLPINDHTPSGVLDLTLNYCEFIPEAAIEQANPPIYLSHELELGQRYSILLTTPGGLYRYHINDIVEVTGFYHQVPMLAFVRKGKDMSNLTGEKLHVNQILLAMEQVQHQFALAIGPYQWVPNLQEMNYQIYVEWRDSRSDPWIQQVLLPTLDQALQRLNGEYAQKRASHRLQPLRLHRMQPGWSNAVQKAEIVAHGRDVQYKWKVLAPSPSISPAPFHGGLGRMM